VCHLLSTVHLSRISRRLLGRRTPNLWQAQYLDRSNILPADQRAAAGGGGADRAAGGIHGALCPLMSSSTMLNSGFRFLQINGRPLVAAETTERLAAAVASPDGRFLLTGGAKGSVRLRWLHSLQVLLACAPAKP